MKAVILAGGFGTRLAEYTDVIPKPMVEVGHHPILWHIMKHLSTYGIREFVIALGYKGDVVKRYMADYALLRSDFSVNLGTGETEELGGRAEDWLVHLIDTGEGTGTGGRLRRLRSVLGDETFLMTYGDGVADVNVEDLLTVHRREAAAVTLTAVRPPARYGALEFDGPMITRFQEKPVQGEGWINGGFFAIEPSALDHVADDSIYWEREPLESLARSGMLAAHRHQGFWQSMDNIRDLRLLRGLWEDGSAPWKTWS